MSVIKREPLRVTAGFTGQELTLASVAAQIAVLAEYEENLMSAIKRFVTVKNGSAIILTATRDGNRERLLVVPENLMFIGAALATQPALRARFAEVVDMLLKEGRETKEYQEMLSARQQLIEEVRRIDEVLKEMDEEFVYPFVISETTQQHQPDSAPMPPRQPTRVQHSQRERTRSRGSHKYSLSEYVFPRRVNGRLFYLRRGYAEIVSVSGKVTGEYHVADEYGNIHAVGDTFAEADRRWHESRGMSPNISTPREWDIAEQERRAEAGQKYHIR
jgi:hypothetical protein